ncbi:uroporphyrinogen-III synthase [Futiania mangrovi]|uniref:Uroporphyrinogen-III synthase n=1 Tax=Futiania mangrovi TaxID=2959716 RepID=A0A9J6PFI7_9PROT|nr:uroporphyrinogen-III synthase [Futiania mangrovii]MCP1336592.1 uroporphyrinogen-III synthase [Futiania mangrovii]
MRVLLTRPAEDAARTAAAFAGRGAETMCAPVMQIRMRTVAPEALRQVLTGAQTLLVTSANGARAFAAAVPERGYRVLAVGPASADAARDAGFADVLAADGDVHALAALVRGRVTPDGGPLVHVAGTHRAGDLAAMLARDGFEVRRLVLYEAVPVPALDPGVQKALAAGQIDAVAHFSPRSARVFEELLAAAGLAAQAGSLDALCLSRAVADALRLPWRTRRIAEHPEVEALAALVP